MVSTVANSTKIPSNPLHSGYLPSLNRQKRAQTLRTRKKVLRYIHVYNYSSVRTRVRILNNFLKDGMQGYSYRSVSIGVLALQS